MLPSLCSKFPSMYDDELQRAAMMITVLAGRPTHPGFRLDSTPVLVSFTNPLAAGSGLVKLTTPVLTLADHCLTTRAPYGLLSAILDQQRTVIHRFQ